MGFWNYLDFYLYSQLKLIKSKLITDNKDQSNNKMGNQACCEGSNPTQHEQKIVIQLTPVTGTGIVNPSQSQNHLLQASSSLKKNQIAFQVPQLSQPLKETLEKLNPFPDKLKNSNNLLHRYNDQIYQGQTDQEGRPQGYGKMYFPNKNSIFLGNFNKGKAEGQGCYIWSDGSFYKGKMRDNKANDQNGIYQNKVSKFRYQGQIKQNIFEGDGKQTGEFYQFVGRYQNGHRKHGKLIWRQPIKKEQSQPQKNGINQKKQVKDFNEYIYIGQFTQDGSFTGQSYLQTPLGNYKGSFKQGMKNGYGVFSYNNKIRYEGNYKNDIKQGLGTIFSKDNKIAYCGEMHNGLPHGDGWVPGLKGEQINMKWDNGISSHVVQNQEVKNTLDGAKK